MIIVCGGAGFIGSNFIENWLINRDEEILNLDILTYAANKDVASRLSLDPRCEFIVGDICNTSLLKEIFETKKPRAIINFAAESHVDRSIAEPSSFIKTNVTGISNLLNVSLEYWQNSPSASQEVFRFFQISTDEVFGALNRYDDAFTEASQYNPSSPYSASKAAGDHLTNAYHKTFGLPTLITNCSNNYGKYQHTEKLIPLIISNAVAGESLPVYGDGSQVRDWLHVSDHCRAILDVLDHGEPGAQYNVGGNNEIINIDLVGKICEILDQLRPREDGETYFNQVEFVTDRLGHDLRYAVNSNKIYQDLGWEPRVDFNDGLRDTIDLFLKQND